MLISVVLVTIAGYQPHLRTSWRVVLYPPSLPCLSQPLPRVRVVWGRVSLALPPVSTSTWKRLNNISSSSSNPSTTKAFWKLSGRLCHKSTTFLPPLIEDPSPVQVWKTSKTTFYNDQPRYNIKKGNDHRFPESLHLFNTNNDHSEAETPKVSLW